MSHRVDDDDNDDVDDERETSDPRLTALAGVAFSIAFVAGLIAGSVTLHHDLGAIPVFIETTCRVTSVATASYKCTNDAGHKLDCYGAVWSVAYAGSTNAHCTEDYQHVVATWYSHLSANATQVAAEQAYPPGHSIPCWFASDRPTVVYFAKPVFETSVSVWVFICFGFAGLCLGMACLFAGPLLFDACQLRRKGGCGSGDSPLLSGTGTPPAPLPRRSSRPWRRRVFVAPRALRPADFAGRPRRRRFGALQVRTRQSNK